MELDAPSALLQKTRGGEGIAGVVSFAGKDEAAAGMWEELLDRTSNARGSLIHEIFCRAALGEGCLLGGQHLGGSDDHRFRMRGLVGCHWQDLPPGTGSGRL